MNYSRTCWAGWTSDEKGMGGIEQRFDKAIRGRPGRVMVMADGKRRFYDRREAAADPGASVVLTIDETIQYIAEKELARGMEETHAHERHGGCSRSKFTVRCWRWRSRQPSIPTTPENFPTTHEWTAR